ncbi:hypothetical protein [Actinoplanes teichomyceticus]|uniref:hypothetical protein n=1 Tax=Actinoplanes teichomyceticus TaxID=1867 RepID=UPI000F0A244E|nr:hypothetical protein [Actinoplanes teichomyceticus]GIF12456.1 hypothetical protein Ate01nite_24880 [Actinoplanes teichomyceticus]
MPTEIPARPIESSYEPHADLMSRLAERAMLAERSAARTVEAEYRKVAAAITEYAAEQQREHSAHVRTVLAEALAQVEKLRGARALALASRTVQTADEIGEAAVGRRSAPASVTPWSVPTSTPLSSSAGEPRESTTSASTRPCPRCAGTWRR